MRPFKRQKFEFGSELHCIMIMVRSIENYFLCFWSFRSDKVSETQQMLNEILFIIFMNFKKDNNI